MIISSIIGEMYNYAYLFYENTIYVRTLLLSFIY